MTLKARYQQVGRYLKRGQLGEAGALFFKLLEAQPGSPQVLHRLGIIAHHEEDLVST